MKKTTFLIVGKHAVVEALKNPKRKIDKVFVTEDAQKNGWEKINETVPTAYVSANKEANKGNIVIAGVEDDANLLGHVSIVRPSNRSDYLIKRDGPDTIASSKINARSVFLKEDFMFNRKELEPFENKLQFFVNRN